MSGPSLSSARSNLTLICVLSQLFGVKVPDGIVPEAGSPASNAPISWYYPHVFYSYPKALPRVTFQDPVIGDGVYYTSGMESFISTMETNALMGKNVARLIMDDAMGISVHTEIGVEGGFDHDGNPQKVVCDRGGEGRGQGRGEGRGEGRSDGRGGGGRGEERGEGRSEGRGGGRGAGEVPKTRPTEAVMQDL